MDESDKTFPELVGIFRSWIPWRSEPAHVSRDFWMPDQSCRVCYECDSQFTLFNRRHHCRLCGRIFCAKCTSNRVPTIPGEQKNSQEDWDKIRVCNYCFKQWEQDLTVVCNNGPQSARLDPCSTSPSANSARSARSSGTFESSSTTFVSVPESAAVLSPLQSTMMQPSIDRQSVVDRQSVGAAKTNDIAVDIGEQNRSPNQFENRSPNQFGFYQNRSDDDDEVLGTPHLGSRAGDFSQIIGYYGPVQFEDINSDYNSRKVHPDEEATDSKSLSNSPLLNNLDFQSSEEVQQIVRKGVEHDTGDECEAPSSLYVAEDVNAEPVDFENNGVLWLPPEPEDEEDEKETLVEEDDEGDSSGEWGYFHNSSSSASGESRSREKSNEDQKRPMTDVVEGHFRALVAQLLQVENLLTEEENEKESWLEILIALSWEAATLLKPDTSKGGQMDPGGYVKVKCLASGLRSESMVVKGIVCKKNVAHRRMTSRIEKPRLLILGGALEYQRVSTALSSFDTLLQQEMDHLKMAVAKIDAHNPDILLVEKSVSRYAQDYLLAKEISLVLNIKRPLLERIARCTGAQIVPSIDHLSPEKIGHCDMFHVTRCTEEHGSAGQPGKKLVKTLMYFEGCPKPLGCTILLRGASGDDLKKVKHVLQYGIFAAYHLALETSFLADEGASLPALPLDSPITVSLADKSSTIDRAISTIPGSVPASEKTIGPQSVGEPLRSNSVPLNSVPLNLLEGTIVNSETYDVSSCMSSQYAKPFISSSIEVFQHSSWSQPSLNHALEDQCHVDFAVSSNAKSFGADKVDAMRDSYTSSGFGDSKMKIAQSNCGNIDANRNFSDLSSLQSDGKQILEQQPALKEEFPPSPSDLQSILVSLSSRCVWKGTVCERAHLFRIKYYGTFDKPLGRFLRDHLFDQSYICRSCEMPAEAHVQCYTHRQGTLTISVKKLPGIILPGEKDGKIWMWHRCLKCPRANGYPPATRRVVMSDAAWGLSFGKFLELSFSNHAAASRVATCGHSLHRDCLRFYGFGQMVACFRYASIDVHSVFLPPSVVDFTYESQEWIDRELNEVVGRAELLFSEVLNALRLLAERKLGSTCMNIPKTRRHITELEEMMQKEKSEFEESLQKTLNKEAKIGQPVIDILDLNRLRRQLIFQSFMWDSRLISAASLDSRNQPDKKEITSSVSTQKPVDVTEKFIDPNVPVKKSKDSTSSESICADAQSLDHGTSNTPNNHLQVVSRKTDLSISCDQGDETALALSHETKASDESDPLVSGVTVQRALSDGQAPTFLPKTLDAAWTGESQPGIGTPKNYSSSELGKVDYSPNLRVSEKLEMEDHKDDLSLSKVSSQSSSLTAKGSDVMDDSASWLSMPFVSFYRTFNKNFLGTAQKLDTVGQHNFIYISSFRDPEHQGGARLLLPVGISDTVIPVYDDEPTSIISYALTSSEYIDQLADEPEKAKDGANSILSMQSLDSGAFQSFYSSDEMVLQSFKSLGSVDEVMSTSFRSSSPLDPELYTKALHARVSFTDDKLLPKVKYSVTCYYAKRFEALRRITCPSEIDFIRSLSRCKKWGAQGGKSNVFFAKTLDDRFIIKQVTKTELESFIKFAPGYFKYISESIVSGSPTCLAKILGIYQVTSKHLKGGKEMKMDVLVMENLLFKRNVTRLYDLKGSSRSRYNPDPVRNKVLLDQNLIEAMPTSPLFVGNKAKRLLERAVWNDTAFLASIDVMDYSLLVGVDEEKHELVLGIIDFMRQYTWDKHLETWVKASGILGGPKNASPTVISPKQYKRRFRKAMTTYFLMVPDQWSPPSIIPSKSQTELYEDNSQNAHISTPSAE